MPQRTMSGRAMGDLKPIVACHAGIRVRVFADAYIPWAWVKIPEPDLPTTPPLLVPKLASEVLDFYVHGDGRLAVKSSDQVGKRYRIRAGVEVDVLEQARETYGWLADNQPSLSELRLVTGNVVHTQTGSGKIASAVKVTRIDSLGVFVDLAHSGSVPWGVAGPQPAIDFSYGVELRYDPATRLVKWRVRAAHDGFPSHEFFLESGGMVHSTASYAPSWFSDVGTNVAHPTITQAVQGASALGGVYKRQTWCTRGSFRP